MKFYYGEDGRGKLVRDKLDDVIRAEGHKVKVRKLDAEDLSAEILKKIPEEVAELLEAMSGDSREAEKEELADVWALLEAFQKARGFLDAEISEVKAAKAAKKGGFDEGTFIEYVDLRPEGEGYDFWLEHFRKNADRYIEEK